MTFSPNDSLSSLLRTFPVPAVEHERASAGARLAERALRRAQRSGETDILIIGNGIAGCVAALECRRHLPDADILMISSQPHPTISTPALKQYGAGKIAREGLLAFPAGAERQSGIGILTDTVTSVHAKAQLARTASGLQVRYQRCLSATGGVPRRLDPRVPGRDFDGVLTLHGLKDYSDLRRRLGTGEVKRAVVVGGGYHALETALLLAERGVRPTLLARGRCLASQVLDTSATDLLLKHLADVGVEILLESALDSVIGHMGQVAGVFARHAEHMTHIPCDLLCVCIGTQPNPWPIGQDSWADTDNGLPVDQNLMVPASLATPSTLWAAGDVASVYDEQSGRDHPRAQWYFAFQQGRLAAAALSGHYITEEARRPAMGAWWHTTTLGKLSLTSVGCPTRTEEEGFEVRTRVEGGEMRRIVTRDDRLVGFLSVGRPISGLALKHMIDEETRVGGVPELADIRFTDLAGSHVRQRLSFLRQLKEGKEGGHGARESAD